MQHQKDENARRKKAKDQLENEMAELHARGVSRGPDGLVYLIADVGRSFGQLGKKHEIKGMLYREKGRDKE